MNGRNLLVGLSYIDQKYIEESEMETIGIRGGKTLRRPLLIAALVALMLLLVGCAVVYVLSLQKLQIGEYQYTEPRYIDEAGNKVYATEKNGMCSPCRGWLEVPVFRQHRNGLPLSRAMTRIMFI